MDGMVSTQQGSLMTKFIYSEKDNQEFTEAMEKKRPTQEDLQKQLSSLTHIKDILTSDKVIQAVPISYFSSAKGKVSMNIDKTGLEPTTATMLAGKRFEEVYYNQLESFIYNDSDKLNPDRLLELIMLQEYIDKGTLPIKIITGKYKGLTHKLVKTLNEFFNDNGKVIKSMSTMFKGKAKAAEEAVV